MKHLHYNRISVSIVIAAISSLLLAGCGEDSPWHSDTLGNHGDEGEHHDMHETNMQPDGDHDMHGAQEHNEEPSPMHGTRKPTEGDREMHGDMDIPDDARQITVTATDYAFEPATIHAEPGETLFIQLENKSHSAHMWQLKGMPETHMHAMSESSDSVVITAPEKVGSYEIFCGIENHKELGMVGTLKVATNKTGPNTTQE